MPISKRHQIAKEKHLFGEILPGKTSRAGLLEITRRKEKLPSDPATHFLRRSLFEQVEKQPRNPVPWILLGWSSVDVHCAVEYFARALEADSENALARDGLIWAREEIEAAEAALGVLGTSDVTPGAQSLQMMGDAAGGAEVRAMAPTQRDEAPLEAETRRIYDFRWRTIARFYHNPFFRNLSIALIYLLLICAAEIITVFVNPIVGIVFHASIMMALLIHGSVIQQEIFRRYLIFLALLPLIRLLSMSLPLLVFDYPVIYRYMIVGGPILLAAFLAVRSVGFSTSRLYLTWRGWPIQLLFGLTGFGLGYCEYFILRPQSLVPFVRWFDITIGIFILFVFTGFLEESIFRGLLQESGIQLFGRSAIWMVSILFGVMHIGYFSAFDVFFAGSVGLLFSYFTLKTRSLLGVSIAHGITNITLYILLPMLLH